MSAPAGAASAVLVFATVASGVLAMRSSARSGAGKRFSTHVPRVVGQRRHLRAPAWVHKWVAESGVGLDADGAWVVWIIGTVLSVGALAFTVGAGAASLAAVGTVGAPVIFGRAAARRSRQRVGAMLPAALDELARSLRAGASLAQAISEAGRATPGGIGDDLVRIAAAHQSGMPLAAALTAWPDARPVAGVRLAASALVLGLGAGGTHARAVDGVAATLRDHLAIAAEVRAQASQAQASALVIGLAPIGFTALACLADPRTATFLFQTTAGLVCVAIGLALDAVGAVWMARITKAEQ